LPGGFTGFYLAAGEFPFTRTGLASRSLCKEDFTICTPDNRYGDMC
jgi:hypothetical protein